MKKIILALAVLVCCSGMMRGGGSNVPSVFVSTTGNDTTGNGSVSSPFATPAKAQTVVQGLLAAGAPNVNVIMRGGTYNLASTLALTSADGPGGNQAVMWKSYPGENAILSGGTKVTGWTLCTTADAVCNSGAGGVYQASVTSPTDFREAYFGGTHGIRSRGTFHPSGWSVNSSTAVYTAPSNSVTPTSSWTNPTHIEIVSQQGWMTSYCPIGSISGTTITLSSACTTALLSAFFPRVTLGFSTPAWIENAYELLPTCGQTCWYYNTSTQLLYYIPTVSQNMATLDVEVPSTFQLVTGSGVSNVTFSRLTFEYSTWLGPNTGGVGFAEIQSGYYCTASGCPTSSSLNPTIMPGALDFVSGSSNINFTHNLFTHLAGRALTYEHSTTNGTVYANLFTDDAGGSLQIGDQTDYAQTNSALQTAGFTVQDNEMDAQFEYLGSGAIFVPVARSSTIENNYIPSNPWVPISVGWSVLSQSSSYTTGISVLNNHTDLACNNWPLEDCGDIYVNLTAGSGTPVTVSGNYASGLGGNSTNFKKACLYPDNFSFGGSWTGNVCDGPASGNDCSTNGVNGGCWAFLWTSSVQNATLTGNFVTSTKFLNNGTGNTISGNTTYTHGSPPSGATAIINAAGIESGVTPGP